MVSLEAPAPQDKRAFGKSPMMATPDGETMFVGVELAGLNGKIYRYERVEGGDWRIADTITKGDANGQLFGGTFDVDENILAVLHPQIPGPAANLPQRVVKGAHVKTWSKNGDTWVEDPSPIYSMDHDFGSAGIAVTDKLLAITTSGPSETMEKTAIMIHERVGSSWSRIKTIYPSEWGPNAGAFRFSKFDMKGDTVVAVWNDGMSGDTVNDFGPIRVYNARSGELEKVITEKTVHNVVMVNDNMFLAAVEDGVDVYTRTPGKTDWGKSNTFSSPSGELNDQFGKTISVSKNGVAIRYARKAPGSKGGAAIYTLSGNSLSYSHLVEEKTPTHYSDAGPIVLTDDDLIITSAGIATSDGAGGTNDAPLMSTTTIILIVALVLLLAAVFVYRKQVKAELASLKEKLASKA